MSEKKNKKQATVKNLGALIRKTREEKGISQNKLSERAKVPQPTICRIEKGKSLRPREATLRPIAKALRLTLAQVGLA